MKKIVSVLCLAAVLASLTGCHHTPAASPPPALPAESTTGVSTSQAARSSGQMTPADRQRMMQERQGH